MTSTRPSRLVLAAALSLGSLLAAPAYSQDDPAPEPSQQEDSAEAAYLRAYYLEIGAKDPDAAAAAYDALVTKAPSGPLAAKGLLGLARCLHTLGRHAEADAAVRRILQQFAGDSSIVSAAQALGRGATPDDTAIVNNVLTALRDADWGNRVPPFGDVAVPTLARSMRTADPQLVVRAAGSLLSIGSDAACDALLAALRNDAVAYPEQVVRAIRSQRGIYPDRLGDGIAALPTSETRDELIVSGGTIFDPRPWLVRAFLERADVRELLLASDLTSPSVPALVRAALEAGPGPARDRVVEHVRGIDADRARTVDWGALGGLSGRALDDEEALSALAEVVLWRTDPDAALRDALLRSSDPRCRSLALHRTWTTTQLPRPSRDLLRAALVDYDWKVGNTSQVAAALFLALDGAPTDDEWALLIPRANREVVWYLVERVADAGNLTTVPLGLMLDADRPHSVLTVLETRGPIDAAWALRRLPALLQHEDREVRKGACTQLAGWHRAGLLDATSHADDLAAAMPRLERRISSGRFDIVFDALMSMGDGGVRAYAANLRFDRDRASDELVRLHEAGRAEAADVARRWIADAPAEGLSSKPLLDAVEVAVTILALRRPVEAVDALVDAWTRWDPDVSRDMNRRAVGGLDSSAAERLLLLAIERLGPQGALPNGVGVLESDARLRVAAAALASAHADVQRSGAAWEVGVRDPEAKPRLAELATSGRPDVRSKALEALGSIREAEAELARVRAIAERSKTDARVRAYLSSASPRERMAGIAGIVALRAPDALERLLDIAAGDDDAEVAAEARRALMRLGAGNESARDGE